MKKGEIIKLNIDKLVHGGEGIGKYDGMTVFVPDCAPGDILEVRLISVKKNYAKGVINKILEPSKSRYKSACTLTACGGCQWQFIDYETQLNAKKEITAENLKKIAGVDIPVTKVIPCDLKTSYRCKIQYPVGQTKVSKRFSIGYYRKMSHDIVNVKVCPAANESVNKIAQYVRDEAEKFDIDAYNETLHKGLLRHLVFRCSHSEGKILLILAVNSNKINESLKNFCLHLKENFKEISGILVNFNDKITNAILGQQTVLVDGDDFITETMDDKKFKISAGSFFQVNPTVAGKIFEEVKEIIEKNFKTPGILDIYSGTGTFSIWLKDIAKEITGIEESHSSIADAEENLKLNPKNADRVTFIEGNALDVLKTLKEAKKAFDIAVLDPPRKGCEREVLEILPEVVKKAIIYVSCDSASLARDIKLLEEYFTPKYAVVADMFPNTYHCETIVLLEKK